MTNKLQIAVIIGESNPNPFFLVETFATSEGPRTRVCSGRWNTREDAEKERNVRLGTPSATTDSWNDKARRDGFVDRIEWIKEYRRRAEVDLRESKDAYETDKSMPPERTND